MNAAASGPLLGAVLAAGVAAVLVLPKLLLLEYSNRRMGPRHGLGASCLILAQDLLLASAIFAAVAISGTGSTFPTAAAGFLVTGTLLLLLLLDARVRQFWQRPADMALVRYALSNRTGVSSGSRIFFALDGGWNVRFGVLAILAESSLALLWLGSALCGRSAYDPGADRSAWLALLAGPPSAFCLLAVVCPRHRHRIEENIVVAPLVNLLRPRRPALRVARLGDPHPAPASAGPQGGPGIARAMPPCENLVLVALESVRWPGLGLEGDGPTVAPILRRRAREGILARCYASVPHTSKSYYAILSGRHPPRGIEMRETRATRHRSLLWSLREASAVRTYCFSSQFLAFEDTRGLLRGLGVEHCLEMRDLARARGVAAEAPSSFGTRDDLLADEPAEILAREGRPFAALFLPLAAHYPYEYPGKPREADDGIESYWRSVGHCDAFLERLVDRLRSRGLLERTLLVILGDHGESFGEHGMFLHNNSMYEEEVTTPLVFWTADGRLERAGTPVARQVDVAPTIADLMGLHGVEPGAAGESLLRSERQGPAMMASFFDGVARALVADGRKYIHYPPSGELLMLDLVGDPSELRPRAVLDEPLRHDVLARLEEFERGRAAAEDGRQGA